MKKILAVALSALMLITALMSLTSCAEERTLFEGNIYELSEDGESYAFAELDQAYAGTEFTVPETVNDKPVTAIGEGAFGYNFPNIEKITLPNTIKTIETNAFRDCTALTSVNIPDGVTKIGNQAFLNCTSLTTVKLPDSVTTIGRAAFDGCESLKSVNIPDGVTKIDEQTFYNCESLTSIDIPDSVTSIGYLAFCGCNELKTLDIPKNVTSIDSSAWSGSSYFEKITYGGTKAEWQQATGTDDSESWEFPIHCSDGVIESDEN